MTDPTRRTLALFGRLSRHEARRVAEILREETIGGVLLLCAALLGMAWANSRWSAAYESVRDVTIGPAALHLDLSLATWAADGLLAIFFFVAGLELKREFVAGDLRDPRRAAVPVAAALGGVLVPAALYLAVTLNTGGDAAQGWAVPTATDIAFALAVLAVIGRNLPTALRTFLLTLAVVDDLLAILIIALFYTTDLSVVPLLAALAPLGGFAALVRWEVRAWWLLLPLAVATWVLVHESGVHATVAGVLLAFTVPVHGRPARRGAHPGPGHGRPAGHPDGAPGPAGHPDGGSGPAERFEYRFRPISAGIAVPVFAFLAAGVPIGGLVGLASALTDRVALGIIVGLVVGKAIGITLATWLTARFTRAVLDEGLTWTDVLGLAMLGGIGFTVSLLIGELAFGLGTARDDHVNLAVLTGSLAAALLAATVLRARDRAYRRIRETEAADPEPDDAPSGQASGQHPA